MKRRSASRQKPTAEDWAGYEDDLDVRDVYRMMFGKTIEDVQHYFGGVQSISRADELLFMPRKAFQYYVFAFAKYVLSEEAQGDSDTASPFLRLLVSREKRDPGSVRAIYPDLEPTVTSVTARQSYYDADPSIYGNFRDHEAELRRLCGLANEA